MTPLFFLIARSFSRPFWKSRQKLGVGTEEIRAEVKALNAGAHLKLKCNVTKENL